MAGTGGGCGDAKAAAVTGRAVKGSAVHTSLGFCVGLGAEQHYQRLDVLSPEFSPLFGALELRSGFPPVPAAPQRGRAALQGSLPQRGVLWLTQPINRGPEQTWEECRDGGASCSRSQEPSPALCGLERSQGCCRSIQGRVGAAPGEGLAGGAGWQWGDADQTQRGLSGTARQVLG